MGSQAGITAGRNSHFPKYKPPRKAPPISNATPGAGKNMGLSRGYKGRGGSARLRKRGIPRHGRDFKMWWEAASGQGVGTVGVKLSKKVPGRGTEHERRGRGRNPGDLGRGCGRVGRAVPPRLEKNHTNFWENGLE